MTFKGTEHRSALQVINALESVGGELNAFTNKEDTVFYAAVTKEHFTKAINLLTDIVFHSQYPQQEIDKEVEVICDEIESYNDTPAELIKRFGMSWMLFAMKLRVITIRQRNSSTTNSKISSLRAIP